MSNHKTDVLLPVGRFVMGSLTDPQTTDADGNPLLVKSGPQTGQPRINYFFAVAIPKNGAAHWWETPWGAKILAVGQAAFPNQCQSPKFAWKIEDGDSQIPNSKGNKPCDREGFPGNFIVRLGSGFAPKTLTAKGDAPVDPASIKLGHYIEVLCTVDGNGSAQQPGIYINHAFVAHSGFGPEIYVGPDPSSVGFGQSALPPGASSTPAPAMTPPTAPGAAPTPPAAPMPPAAAAVAAPPVPVPTVPHTAILAGPPAPPARVMLPKAQGASYEALLGAGWTDALLIEHGMMQA